MGKTLIMAVLSIGIVTLVSINAYATRPGNYVPYSDEKALDLSKPENIARLTGKWEGTWENFTSNNNGQLLQEYSVDRTGEEEKPVLRRAKRRPAGILGGAK
jgi:hypothetical protein